MNTKEAVQAKLRSEGGSDVLTWEMQALCEVIDAQRANDADERRELARKVNGTGGTVIDREGT